MIINSNVFIDIFSLKDSRFDNDINTGAQSLDMNEFKTFDGYWRTMI